MIRVHRRRLSIVLAGLVFAVLAMGCPVIPDPGIVPEEVREPATWTILLYMTAESSEEAAALEAINALEAGIGGGETLRVVVLIDRGASGYSGEENWTDSRLYEIKPDSLNQTIVSQRLSSVELGISATAETELNLAEGDTIAAFVDFGTSIFPSSHLALIVWGAGQGMVGEDTASGTVASAQVVGTGFGVGSRSLGFDESSSHQILSVRDVAAALDGHNADIVVFDSSMSALFEFAYEFRDTADYLVASQDSLFAGHGDYEDLLGRLNASDQSPAGYVTALIDSYQNTHRDDETATISAIDTSQLPAVMSSLNAFADAASTAIDNETKQTEVRDALSGLSISAYVTPGDLQLDLVAVAQTVAGASGMGSVAEEADALATAVDEAVLAEWHHADSPAFSGLSIFYVPLLSSGGATVHPETYYADTDEATLAFVVESTWTPNDQAASGLLYRLFYRNF